jgi:hypothetical protein
MVRGRAEIGGKKMFLYLPRRSRVHPAYLARIVEHEISHLKGKRHEQMTRREYWSRGKLPSWAKKAKI